MNTTEKIKVCHAYTRFKGYGHYNIIVELYCEQIDDYHTFEAITNNMPDFDAAQRLEGQRNITPYMASLNIK
jgi:hypothetical protein